MLDCSAVRLSNSLGPKVDVRMPLGTHLSRKTIPEYWWYNGSSEIFAEGGEVSQVRTPLSERGANKNVERGAMRPQAGGADDSSPGSFVYV